MNPTDFHGMIPPIATPMHADGSLNLDAMSAMVEHVLAGGVHGIFSPGSQGEAFALNADERRAVIESVVAAVNGRVPVIAGTGAITTRDAIRFSQDAERAGADAIAAVTPFFIAPTQDEIYTYYAAIAAAVSVPVFGYSNPSRTGGLKIAPETLARLAADIPHFIGVKDSSGDLAETAAILRACPEDFRVFVGRDTLIYGGLCYGTAGAVGLTINVNPAAAVKLYDAFQAGDHAGALKHQETIAVLRNTLPRFGTYPVWVKEALNLMGVPVGPARKPVQPLSDLQRADLRAFLASVGLV
jgi:4-hydroxy-tetrahydrodipicolinate synthase